MIIGTLPFCSIALGQESVTSADAQVVASLRALIPASGTVEVIFERREPPEVQAIGYDFQSGWWYEFRAGVGVYFNGAPGPRYVYGADVDRARLRIADHDNYIERFVFPSAWVHRVLRTSGCVRSIARTVDSGYELRVWTTYGDPVAPSGVAESGGDSEFICTVSADGRTVQISSLGGSEKLETSIIGHVGPGLPVGAVGSGGWQLTSARFVENSAAETIFNEAHVKAVVQNAREQESHLKRASLASKRANSPPGPDAITFANAFTSAPGSRWGSALVVAGGLLIAIGAWLWWKNRR
jgi:hypothetical protein